MVLTANSYILSRYKHTLYRHEVAQKTLVWMLAQCSQSFCPWERPEHPSLSGCDSGTSLLDPQPFLSRWMIGVPGLVPQKSLCGQSSKEWWISILLIDFLKAIIFKFMIRHLYWAQFNSVSGLIYIPLYGELQACVPVLALMLRWAAVEQLQGGQDEEVEGRAWAEAL